MSPFTAPVTVQTPRLTLRRHTADDAKEIFETYAQDPEVTRFLTWAPHRSLDDTHAFLAYCEHAWERRTAYPWLITRREDARIAGSIELRRDGAHRIEVGYAVARPMWGRGYATEAVRVVLALALLAPSIHRVWACVDLANVASARVLEKAGFAREATLRKWYVPTGFGVPRDVACYAALSSRQGEA